MSPAEHTPDGDPSAHQEEFLDGEASVLHAEDAEEEIEADDGDAHMDEASDGDADDMQDDIQLRNDSVACFDKHKDSIFCIARHPLYQNIVATGSGDDSAFVFDTASAAKTNDNHLDGSSRSLRPLAHLQGHTDSVNVISFTMPNGDFVLTGGLDGQIRAYATSTQDMPLVASNKEVDEINFIVPNPAPEHANTFAIGASDGSVWVYGLKQSTTDPSKVELDIIQAYYLHTLPATAGAWTSNGAMLVTVSEDSSLYVWDPFEEAASAGISSLSSGQALVAMSSNDERFRVEGGLYSIAVSPSGAFAAAGGAGGAIRIVGLPRFDVNVARGISTGTQQGTTSSRTSSGGRQSASRAQAKPSAGAQAGALLATLNEQSDSVESIAFSPPPLTLMATGSVDGSIVLYDASQRFGVRRHIREAHGGEAVIKLEYSNRDAGKLLSCGNDGVLRIWDVRGRTDGSAQAGNSLQGLTTSLYGHRGGGDGGGIMGFVQSSVGDGIEQAITAGDDGLSLVFDLKY